MPLVGQPVVDGDAGVCSQFLHLGLRVAAELDGVVHAAEDTGGVGDRLLVSHLRTGRVEIGDMRALVEGRDLERRTRAGRGLLEDQSDLFAFEPLDLGARELGDLQRF